MQSRGIRMTGGGGGGKLLKGVGRWLDRGLSRLIGGDSAGGPATAVSDDDDRGSVYSLGATGGNGSGNSRKRGIASDLSPVSRMAPTLDP